MDATAIDTFPAATPILVTGATGFTGAVLVRRLVEMGVDVRAIARESSDISPLQDVTITWFRGDVYDPDMVAAACEGVEYIFHVAAAFRVSGIADSVYRDVHVTSTQFLGAFNDNLFKQLMLLLSLKVATQSEDLQPVAMVVFSAPFLLFSGFAE